MHTNGQLGMSCTNEGPVVASVYRVPSIMITKDAVSSKVICQAMASIYHNAGPVASGLYTCITKQNRYDMTLKNTRAPI